MSTGCYREQIKSDMSFVFFVKTERTSNKLTMIVVEHVGANE